MTSVRERGWPTQKGQASEALTSPPSSNWNHDDPLGSNELETPKAPASSEAAAGPETPAGPKVPPGPPQAPPLLVSQDPSANCYSQQDLDRIIQTFLHVSKGGSRDKLKAKTTDVYRSRSYMEYCNFCQQCKDHFATCGAIGSNRIPFTTSFLRDRINFR